MSMNEGRYPELYGSHGSFLVHSGSSKNSHCWVKVYAPVGDEAMEKQIVGALIDLQKEFYFPLEGTTYFTVRGKKLRHPRTGKPIHEYAIELDAGAEKALNWLQNNTNHITLQAENVILGEDGWSVGPCVFPVYKKTSNVWTKIGQYAKVRFDKLSIPFHVDEDRKVWLKEKTLEYINTDPNCRLMVNSIMGMLLKNETEILARIRERSYNYSGICEYDSPWVSFFKETPNKKTFNLVFHQGNSNKIDQAKLADPSYSPVITLKYDAMRGNENYKDKTVVFVGDSILQVNKFTMKNDHWSASWNYAKAITFNLSDCTPVDPREEYLLERACRALKTKL